MQKGNKRIERNQVLAMVVGLSVWAISPMTIAAAATDLVCTECVETSDLAVGAVGTDQLKNGAVGTYKLKNGAVTTDKLKNGAVGTNKLKNGAVGTDKLKNGAVGTAKIKNGAITYAKLAPDLKTVMDGAEVYDYRDYGYGGTSGVTQRVYAISGLGLWECGGVGTVDTEVRDIVRTALPDGTFHIEVTNRPYTGGAGGTSCNKSTTEYISDTAGLRQIRNRNYAEDSITVMRETSTSYDINTDPNAGIMVFSSDMKFGIDFVSSGLSTDDTTPGDGLYFSEGLLVEAGVTATVDAGGPNEELIPNCIMVREHRLSTHFGYAERVRTICPGIGMVNLLKGEPNTGKTRHYRLIDYTVAP